MCLQWAHDVAFSQADNMSTRSLNVVEDFFSKIVSQILPPTVVNINLHLQCNGVATVKTASEGVRFETLLPTVDDTCYYVGRSSK